MKEARLAQDYLSDILEAMDKARTFVAGMTLESFCADEKTSYAVIRCLEIVGEATKKIPIEVRRECTDVPWSLLAGMRDKLIHDYFGVSLEIVWKTVEEDIPAVRAKLEVVLSNIQLKESL